MGCYFSLFCTKWCSFFSLERKEPKVQDRIRSFGLTQVIVRSFALMQKNQKIKAHTPEATVSVAALKSRKTRFAQTAEIF